MVGVLGHDPPRLVECSAPLAVTLLARLLARSVCHQMTDELTDRAIVATRRRWRVR